MRHLKTILMNPWIIILSLAAGAVLGTLHAASAHAIAPLGQLYLLLLQMCVLPIMTSAVITSMGQLVQSHSSGLRPARVIGFFIGGLLLASAIGTTTALVLQPGNALDAESRATLGRLMSGGTDESTGAIATDMEVQFHDKNLEADNEPQSALSFLLQLVPRNVFQALSEGQSIQILLFSVLFGIALGLLPPERSDPAFVFFEAVFSAFTRIIGGLMYILPFGLIALVAEQATRIGAEVLLAMLGYMIALAVAGAIMLILALLIARIRIGEPLRDVLYGFKDTVVIALGTRSGFAAIPSAIEALHDRFKYSRTGTKLVIPLGITVCRHGTVMIFALTTMFLAQLYQVEIGITQIAFILIGVVIAGMASAGAPGIVAISMLGMVLTPLGLPLESAFILLLAIDPITEPLLTLINVQSNCTTATLVTPRDTPGSQEVAYGHPCPQPQ